MRGVQWCLPLKGLMLGGDEPVAKTCPSGLTCKFVVASGKPCHLPPCQGVEVLARRASGLRYRVPDLRDSFSLGAARPVWPSAVSVRRE